MKHKIESRLIWKFVPFLFIIQILGGCSEFNCTRLEDVLGGPTNLITFSYSIADNLVDRALPPLFPQHPDMPILVTTFVDNNNLKKTNQFGRILQEHITSRLVQSGYTVREIKLANTLTIEPESGETMLTRELAQIRQDQNIQAVLVGTVSRTNRILYISARLIDPRNSNIIATDDYQLCMDQNILSLYGLQLEQEYDSGVGEPGRGFLNSIFF